MDKTVAELDFSNKSLFERWGRVREDFWGDLKRENRLMLKRLLERTLEIEMQDMVGGRRWERGRALPLQRNGHYRRGLLTGFGWIPDLSVPRLREGRVSWRCLAAYQRRTPDVDGAALDMFLAGVSQRRVQEVLAPLVGPQAMSASTVSRISCVLDHRVRHFHARPLTDGYRFLILDGVYLKAKSPASVRRRCILVAYGIRQDGVRELIDFSLAGHGESQAAWEVFLTRLKRRGLEGDGLKLAVVDGNRGLWSALDLVWPGLARQRCWAHKLRNVANKLPRRLQPLCLAEAKGIYDAASFGKALAAFRRWKRVWNPIAPEAVQCLEVDLESLLTFYDAAPRALWRKLRTTNVIERVFREVRRRTRPMSCFQNVQSVERILFALFYRHNTIWSHKPLREITQRS